MTGISEQRRSEIIEALHRNQTVKVAELSAQLHVSEVSIRRDLQILEEKGLLKRVHGGAIPLTKNNHGSLLSMRMRENREKKERIGHAAAGLIKEGDRIIIDSGSTPLQIAHHIPKDLLLNGSLNIITCSLPVIKEIGAFPSVHLILLGGLYLPDYEIIVGPQTVEQLKGLHADKLFLGTDGITLSHGITTANVLEAEVDRAMARSATEIIVVSDSSKIGLIGLAPIMPLANIHKLVTDKDAPTDFIEALCKQGVEVLLV
jgi:DeoR/GlpR family transcriptional regulator of sugar metabolism